MATITGRTCTSCVRLAVDYWMLYDHRDCHLGPGAISFIPFCPRHLESDTKDIMARHSQCMGQSMPASLVRAFVGQVEPARQIAFWKQNAERANARCDRAFKLNDKWTTLCTKQQDELDEARQIITTLLAINNLGARA